MAETVLVQTEKAVSAASHLSDMDAGTVAVLLDLARVIDGGLPANDNVTKPTYLKFAMQLGLTPVSREKLDDVGGSGGSKLAELRAIRGGRAG